MFFDSFAFRISRAARNSCSQFFFNVIFFNLAIIISPNFSDNSAEKKGKYKKSYSFLNLNSWWFLMFTSFFSYFLKSHLFRHSRITLWAVPKSCPPFTKRPNSEINDTILHKPRKSLKFTYSQFDLSRTRNYSKIIITES
jgi:hypothetical protein